jgi:hypothetical protein
MENTYAERIKTMSDFIVCYKKHCEKESEIRDKLGKIYIERIKKISEFKKDKIITLERFIELKNIIDRDYYLHNNYIKLYKCQLDKCYNQTDKYLNNVNNENINYKKTNLKYTVDDYKNLIKKTLDFYKDKFILLP